jgi:hypothetical protein
MSVQADLLTLERGFWAGDAELHRGNPDVQGLTAFTQMAGVASKNRSPARFPRVAAGKI